MNGARAYVPWIIFGALVLVAILAALLAWRVIRSAEVVSEVNERLAALYGLPGVSGAQLRKVTLPKDSVRGGFLTQASVLKVTANGTTTSPVLRGKWIMERIAGYEIPPPPASVPAVEPDIRGAVTIRAQLEKHRADESCAACHRNIDPPGFALESFDVLGGYRERYRALAKGQTPDIGFGKNGWPKAWFSALPVDPSNVTAQGKAFADVREFKKILLDDERQIARAKFSLAARGVGNTPKDIAMWMTERPAWRPLGQYFSGMIQTMTRSAQGGGVYLLGTFHPQGVREYCPLVYLMKEPAALHVLTLLALLSALTGLLLRWGLPAAMRTTRDPSG